MKRNEVVEEILPLRPLFVVVVAYHIQRVLVGDRVRRSLRFFGTVFARPFFADCACVVRCDAVLYTANTCLTKAAVTYGVHLT